MSQGADGTKAGSESSGDPLRSLLRRLRHVAPVVGWVFGLGVATPAYQRGDLLDAALRGGAVWALAVLVWTAGLILCERLLAPEAEETAGETPGADRRKHRDASASPQVSRGRGGSCDAGSDPGAEPLA